MIMDCSDQRSQNQPPSLRTTHLALTPISEEPGIISLAASILLAEVLVMSHSFALSPGAPVVHYD